MRENRTGQEMVRFRGKGKGAVNWGKGGVNVQPRIAERELLVVLCPSLHPAGLGLRCHIAPPEIICHPLWRCPPFGEEQESSRAVLILAASRAC